MIIFAVAPENVNTTRVCVVEYANTLKLICSHTNTAYWRRRINDSCSEVICAEPVCLVGPTLHYENSGQYFCRSATSPYSYQDFYVNVTVLGKFSY